jgi:hypothetical protein
LKEKAIEARSRRQAMSRAAIILLLTLIAVWAALAFAQMGSQAGRSGRPSMTAGPVAMPRRPRVRTPPEVPMDTEPPILLKRHPDLARIRRDALELAALAQEIPPQVDKLEKNILPQALPGKLKRIEKLAKQLRKDISP